MTTQISEPIDTLYRELDEWNFIGEEAMLWWRDDDAVADSPALKQLTRLGSRFDVPLALAVIPDSLDASLHSATAEQPLVTVLQHGIAHRNNAPSGSKKQELTSVAGLDTIRKDLQRGFQTLQGVFGDQFCPALVPPWNRIDPELNSGLAEIGFRGLSCYTPRSAPVVGTDIWQINTHADIVNWKADKSFIGAQQLVDQLVAHLAARRTGQADHAEPTGLLTHHLVHDSATWDFLEVLLDAMDQHPAVTWLSAERVFQTRWRD